MIRRANRMCLLLGLATGILVACSTPNPTPSLAPTLTPTVQSIPPATEITEIQVAPTPAPYTGATPAIVIESLQDLSTPTALPPLVAMPTEQLAILEPGPGSQVTSPFRVDGWGGPSFNDRIRVRLIGEDGRVLSQGWSFLLVLPGNAGRFLATVPFEIDHVAEAARLEVSMQSRRDRQLSHLATVDLTLLSIGTDLVHPSIRGTEKLAIFSPRDDAIASGGKVLVRGAGWVDTDTPLTVTVLNNQGSTLGSMAVELDAPLIGQLGTFTVEVPYEIPFSQWAHIVVAEPSTGVIPGWIHYTSVEVWLRP
ncbi:MAG: hypothetical protein GTO14_25325 [Anaerolineales bacterium]|nr:hypothetical protein [Anaerolineales bacterium]